MRYALLIVILLGGCASVPPARVHALTTSQPPRVCLIRGFNNWYSTGIDKLASELQADGVSAEAFSENQWPDLQLDLADTVPEHHAQPLVLIGFSCGADDVIAIARTLNDRHVAVDLLITIDPVTPGTIPPNVKKCISFYEPNGVTDFFPWFRGIPVEGDPDSPPPTNINIRERDDLIEPNMSHKSIAADERLHQAIVTIVKQTVKS